MSMDCGEFSSLRLGTGSQRGAILDAAAVARSFITRLASPRSWPNAHYSLVFRYIGHVPGRFCGLGRAIGNSVEKYVSCSGTDFLTSPKAKANSRHRSDKTARVPAKHPT